MELERELGDLLRKGGWTLAVAESCTGGLISDRLTDVPGSSSYFMGSMVTYSTEAKESHLGIESGYLKRHGVVSPQVARKMAQGVRSAFQTSFGLSTTGVAGPTGGTKKTPLGTVYIGFSNGKTAIAIGEKFKGSRREIREQATQRSLQFLYEQVAGGTVKKERQSIEGRIAPAHSKRSTLVLARKAPRGVSFRGGRVGIFPASFNPPTKAHLALVREARKADDLDEVLVLLDTAAMDKRLVGATVGERLQMLEMLFQEDPEISIGLATRGLFLEKLKPLRRLYPPPVQLTFIAGFDTLLRVMDKRYYKNRKRALDRLFGETRFLVANRGDRDRTSFEQFFSKAENQPYRERVSFFRIPKKFSSLASTHVREDIGKGRTPREGIPAPILQFIRKNGLYKKRSKRLQGREKNDCK